MEVIRIISIVVPVYNTSKYLCRCIDSLLNQNYRDIELILVDDGSTDGSEKICDEYALKDNRVRVIHKTNGGEATARNAGLSAATGEYLMFCDSDDEYLPGSIQKLFDVIKQDGIDLVVGSYLEKSSNVTRLACTMQERYSASELILKMLTDTNSYGVRYIMSTVNATLFKMNIIREFGISFNEQYVVGNDSLFVADYLAYCNEIYDVFTPVYVYYKYDENERIQGMAWVYPDQFKLTLAVTEKLLSIVTIPDRTRSAILQNHFDNMIRQLVIAAAYEIYFKKGLEYELKILVENSLMKESVSVYKRVRINDSIHIPKYFEEKNTPELIDAVRQRGEEYKKINGESKYVRIMVND